MANPRVWFERWSRKVDVHVVPGDVIGRCVMAYGVCVCGEDVRRGECEVEG